MGRNPVKGGEFGQGRFPMRARHVPSLFLTGAKQGSVEKILVATDGSDAAKRAVELAVDMAYRFDAALIALVVKPPRPGYPVEVEGLDRPYREGLEYAEHVASEHNVPFERLQETGDPAEEIVKASEEVEADLVVVGGTSKKGISRLMLGSVAEKVVKESKVPVTVAK